MRLGSWDVEAVIFDFDGTLADSMWVWDHVDRLFLERRGIAFDEEYAENIAVLGFEGGADYVIERFGLDEDPDSIIREWKADAEDGYARHVRLKPGAAETLRALKERGLPLGLATSLQRQLLEPCLENNGVASLFDAICICDELHCGGKSSPAVYLEAARRLGVSLERCAVFEDVVTAARSAKRGGARVIGVYDAHKQQATAELERVVDWFIRDFGELGLHL